MIKRVLISLSFISTSILAGCSTTAIQTDLGIDDLHFPKIADGHDRVVVLGTGKGRLELMDNCIVFNRGYNKPILIWDHQTDVQKVGGSIVITHPRFATLKVGQKVTISGTGAHGYYDPDIDRIPLEPTAEHACKPTGYLEIFEW